MKSMGQAINCFAAMNRFYKGTSILDLVRRYFHPPSVSYHDYPRIMIDYIQRVNYFFENYNRHMLEKIKGLAEQRVVLRSVSWETYKSLLEDHLDRSTPRFTFNQGMLEIISPSPEREKLNRSIALLVSIFTEELGVESEDFGSTTFRREDLESGFEPDSCFYIQNEGQIRGKDRIDLVFNPPPDLVIEVDITNPSINKLPIYAQIGVPEVWRYDGEKLEILKLGDDGYDEAPESVALPALTSSTLSQFMERSKSLRRTVWLREVRQKARELSG